jgi:hypothetical protein
MDQKKIVKLGTLRPFLFAYVKRNLMECRAENLSERLVCIQVILRAIPGETLIEVYSSE